MNYIYHGTVFKNLKNIYEEGLVPGKNIVTKHNLIKKNRLETFVFFLILTKLL